MAMTKKELFAEVGALCAKYEIADEAKAELLALVEPKRGGAKVDIEDIVCRDDEGEITHILDSVLKVWVPILNDEGEDNFYVKEETELGYSRFCRMAEKLRKDAEKTFKATKEAVLTDLLAGDVDQEAAKEILADAESARKILTIPEDFTYEVDSPCAD